MECIFITSLIECIFTKPTQTQTQPLLTPSHISPPPPPQIKPQTPHMAEKPLPFLTTTTTASWDGDEEWDLVTFVAAAARAAAD